MFVEHGTAVCEFFKLKLSSLEATEDVDAEAVQEGLAEIRAEFADEIVAIYENAHKGCKILIDKTIELRKKLQRSEQEVAVMRAGLKDFRQDCREVRATEEKKEKEKVLAREIEAVFSAKVAYALRRASYGLKTVGDLIRLTPKQLLGIKNLGSSAYCEILTFLCNNGLTLAPNADE